MSQGTPVSAVDVIDLTLHPNDPPVYLRFPNYFDTEHQKSVRFEATIGSGPNPVAGRFFYQIFYRGLDGSDQFADTLQFWGPGPPGSIDYQVVLCS